MRVDSKCKTVYDKNVASKKNSSSMVQFDKEELTNILSQDSFADFSQLEGFLFALVNQKICCSTATHHMPTSISRKFVTAAMILL